MWALISVINLYYYKIIIILQKGSLSILQHQGALCQYAEFHFSFYYWVLQYWITICSVLQGPLAGSYLLFGQLNVACGCLTHKLLLSLVTWFHQKYYSFVGENNRITVIKSLNKSLHNSSNQLGNTISIEFCWIFNYVSETNNNAPKCMSKGCFLSTLKITWWQGFNRKFPFG